MSLMKLGAFGSAIFLLGTSAGASPSSESGFKFEKIASVAPYELWHSSLHPFIGDGMSLLYYQFDPEDAARGNRGKACGVLLGGISDLASTPIAIRIWSRSGCSVDTRKSGPSNNDGGSVVLTLIGEKRNCDPAVQCDEKTITFRINAAGQMIADGKVIGVSQ